MRFKVELHRDVVWFIRRQCRPDEVSEFHRWLERLRQDPVTDTETYFDATLAPYLLRSFRFGRNLGIFRLDSAHERILIRQCRRSRINGARKSSP